jgi:hypothetical protein
MEKGKKMLNKTCSRLVAACAVVVSPYVTSGVDAAGLDGSTDIVCAVTHVVACLEDGFCLQGQAKTFDLPDLIVMDAKDKVMRGTHESGHNAVSPIKNMEHNGEHLVIQGVENSRGWDLAVNSRTGHMSASSVGDEVTFLAHGTCTTP